MWGGGKGDDEIKRRGICMEIGEDMYVMCNRQRDGNEYFLTGGWSEGKGESDRCVRQAGWGGRGVGGGFLAYPG